ncbi:hypothetical protein HYPSUDRAFT_213849 [Hypholoma sublateritium FD-334 SS-4]|uniref:Uncharacterized protein n=1 Tax=Hypholoma sublateritium (strain FD-334 SS-4) TaxID=945553 RepID=A0A0D2MNI9_HYPSF|nr:hypothetical protein HYPSUDRAFT_213849 [Hypholoma sublateritium FD-334 SS-4]
MLCVARSLILTSSALARNSAPSPAIRWIVAPRALLATVAGLPRKKRLLDVPHHIRKRCSAIALSTTSVRVDGTVLAAPHRRWGSLSPATPQSGASSPSETAPSDSIRNARRLGRHMHDTERHLTAVAPAVFESRRCPHENLPQRADVGGLLPVERASLRARARSAPLSRSFHIGTSCAHAPSFAQFTGSHNRTCKRHSATYSYAAACAVFLSASGVSGDVSARSRGAHIGISARRKAARQHTAETLPSRAAA